jgi:predicted phosphodiesterase
MKDFILACKSALGNKFLQGRPSYDRCHKRLTKQAPELGEAFSRETYAVMMTDVRRLTDLLVESEVDLEAFEVERYTVNSWSSGNFQVKAHLKPKDKAESQVDHALPDWAFGPPKISKCKAKSAYNVLYPDESCVAFIPDCHVGFVGDEPIHDKEAMAKVWQWLAAKQPHKIVLLGDFLDLPAMSRFDTKPIAQQRTKEAFIEARTWLKSLRELCPKADICYLEGNHEARLEKYLERQAPELWWAVKIPDLLKLEDLDVRYLGPYGSYHEVAPGVKATHGYQLCTTKQLAKYPQFSSVFGHTHRLQLDYRTNSQASPSTVWAMTCGTLARIDGLVPGTPPEGPNWQQGFAVLHQGVPTLIPIEAL